MLLVKTGGLGGCNRENSDGRQYINKALVTEARIGGGSGPDATLRLAHREAKRLDSEVEIFVRSKTVF